MTVEIQEQWADVDGHRMRFLHGGSGPPLVLVHGLLGYSFSWRFNLQTLAQQATVYAVDLLGVGHSDRVPALECGLRASAQRFLHFLDAAAVGPCDLLGTSHGGALAMMAASLAPERVRRLVLVAPANPWSRHGRLLAPLMGSRPAARLVPRLAPAAIRLHSWMLRRLYGDPRLIAPGTLEGYSEPMLRPGTIEQAQRTLGCWRSSMRELESAISRIGHIPTLLLWGDRDPAVYVSSAPRLKKCFHCGELVVFKGVGHLPYEETPERFNRVVLDFLSASHSAA